MNLVHLILFDIITCFIFFPIVKVFFDNTSINNYFVNFKIFYLNKDKLYNIFYNCRGKKL